MPPPQFHPQRQPRHAAQLQLIHKPTRPLGPTFWLPVSQSPPSSTAYSVPLKLPLRHQRAAEILPPASWSRFVEMAHITAVISGQTRAQCPTTAL